MSRGLGDVYKRQVEVVACQVTGQARPNGEKLEEIIPQFREEFPNTLLMADTGDLNDVKEANRLGFDIIGTTMHGIPLLLKV